MHLGIADELCTIDFWNDFIFIFWLLSFSQKNCEMSYPLLSMTFKTCKIMFKKKKEEKNDVWKNIYVLETCLKRKIVFCLILTELFLLKYTHKHIISLLFYSI